MVVAAEGGNEDGEMCSESGTNLAISLMEQGYWIDVGGRMKREVNGDRRSPGQLQHFCFGFGEAGSGVLTERREQKGSGANSGGVRH
jgi:hypothetical protein